MLLLGGRLARLDRMHIVALLHLIPGYYRRLLWGCLPWPYPGWTPCSDSPALACWSDTQPGTGCLGLRWLLALLLARASCVPWCCCAPVFYADGRGYPYVLFGVGTDYNAYPMSAGVWPECGYP